VFTDVVNFSLRMGENETRALHCVRRDFNLLLPLITRFQGHLLKTMGDGQLIYFQSAVEAVRCALAMQQALAQAARSLPPSEVLQHRIGIHVGEVFVAENDVHGNGVNIAARLQGRAEPGGICISQTVYDVVKHQLALKVNYLGAQELRNIRDAVHVYQLLVDAVKAGAAVPPAPASARVPAPKKAPGLSLRVSSSARVKHVRRTDKTPFHLVILGDFSGRSSRNILEPLSGRQALFIDFDNLEEVLGRVQLRLPLLHQPGETVQLHFKTLDDFHPDQLVPRVASLGRLAQLRQRLLNPKTAAAACSEMETLFGRTAPTPAEPTPVETDSALEKQRPGKPASGARAVKSPAVNLDAFIRKLVGSSTGPDSSPDSQPFVARLDLEMTRQLRAILHHPDFQQLEAAWRSVAWLVRNFGGEENIKLFLLDVSKEELTADLRAVKTETTGLHRLLAQQPWGLLIGNYTFGDTVEEFETLDRLAAIAANAGAPFIAAAHPHLAGCESFSEQPDPQKWTRAMMSEVQLRWKALRQSASARHLGLAAPRFLLRQPYGQGSDPIELFPFEELPDDLAHDFYLWGNPAFLCGHVFSEAFLKDGWELTSTCAGRVSDRPVHRFRAGGETQVKSWAEIWLTERGSDLLIRNGLIPTLAMKNQNAIHIPRLQSVASPAKPLAWKRS